MPSRRVVALVLLLAVAAAVLVPTGVVVAGGVSAPGWLPTLGRDARSSPVPRSAPAPPARDLVTDRRAPQRDPQALLQALADRRAELVRTGDPDRLPDLDAPGSAALRQDTSALRDLAARGQRYAGVRLTARDVRLLEVSATRATVQASVDTSAYDLVGGGHVEHRPSAPGVPLRFVLVWDDARWKVDSVLDATRGE